MAFSSEHVAYIRGYGATVLASAGPVDAGATRDAIVNNLIHLHDGIGQQLIALTEVSGAYWTQASPSSTTFNRIDDLPDHTFPVHATTTRSFVIVQRLRVSISVAGTATFRIGLTIGSHSLVPVFGSGGLTPYTCEFTTTSTTGETVAPTAIYAPSTYLPSMVRGYQSLRADDATLGSADTLVATLGIWAKASAGAPRVHGWLAREYIG